MATDGIKKIVYLFGAGATHAELQSLNRETLGEDRGLLISHVSSRVIAKARVNPRYFKGVETVTGKQGSLNIELLISLLENSKIRTSVNKTALLKNLVEDDIKSFLTKSATRRFYLHKGLLELHELADVLAKEEVLGLISLNYDAVLDQAYEEVLGAPINYCFSLESAVRLRTRLPLLKLHGSFNWKSRRVLNKKRAIEIIPLGSSKSYLHAPYGFIWSNALELLTRCDVLRVIGCALSPNDIHLIDLLFKAQLEKETPFDLEIISPDDVGDRIIRDYGFFPNITRLTDMGVPATSPVGPANPFRNWLQYTADRMVNKRELNKTRHLKKVTT